MLPLPETAQGMYDAYHLAKASPRVRGIHGALSGPVSGDFARAFGFRATPGGEEQLYLASKMVLDSRAAGAMHPMAGIFGTAQDDLPAVERLIRKARDIGYSGVAVMHPTHVAIANAVYRPTAEEVAYFKGLLEAFEAAEKAGLGAVSYQGAMVDYAMLPLAREVIAEAARNQLGCSPSERRRRHASRCHNHRFDAPGNQAGGLRPARLPDRYRGPAASNWMRPRPRSSARLGGAAQSGRAGRGAAASGWRGADPGPPDA